MNLVLNIIIFSLIFYTSLYDNIFQPGMLDIIEHGPERRTMNSRMQLVSELITTTQLTTSTPTHNSHPHTHTHRESKFQTYMNKHSQQNLSCSSIIYSVFLFISVFTSCILVQVSNL